MLEGNPDLYGPVWIATTVIFILFLGGTISKYLAESGQGHFVYDFELLSGESWSYERGNGKCGDVLTSE